MSTRRMFNLSVVLLVLLTACNGGAPTTAGPGQATTAPTAPPTPAGLQATVVDVINQVEAQPATEQRWVAALVDMTISAGGAVKAYESSTARLRLEDHLVRVAPNTVFTMSQPDDATLQMKLEQGQVWLNVEGLQPGESFQVETSSAVASVRGTRFSVRSEADGTTIVSTKVHTVTVTAQGSAVDVGEGMQTTVLAGQPPAPAGPMSFQEEVLWGMANGPGLDVVFPAVGLTSVVTYTGSVSSNGYLSADGQYFASFAYYPTTHMGGVFIYDIGSGRAITETLPLGADSVAYSPVGNQMAYDNFVTKEMCTANLDSTSPNCWGLPASPGFPYWSPDGQWLLFYTYGGGGSNLYLARPDGSSLTQLTFTDSGENHAQAWSPDNSQIAYHYQSYYDQPGELWVMNADGSNPTKLIDGTKGYENPVWTPDGQSLLVAGHVPKDAATGGGLFQVPLDGSAPTPLIPPDQGWSIFNMQFSRTPTGWPLIYDTYDLNTETSGSLQVLTGPGATPQFFSNIGWGPVWAPNYQSAAFGDVQTVNPDTEATESTVYFFQTEPAFWPQQTQ